jgi:hypothetical protein
MARLTCIISLRTSHKYASEDCCPVDYTANINSGELARAAGFCWGCSGMAAGLGLSVISGPARLLVFIYNIFFHVH